MNTMALDVAYLVVATAGALASLVLTILKIVDRRRSPVERED
jgi:hypothetical protein